MNREGILLNLFLPRTKGDCIAHFRNVLHLTQIDVSKELGINRSSISKMENGEINVSEVVWNHVLRLAFYELGIEENISFLEFKDSLELFIEVDEGRRPDWTKPKLFWQPVMSI